MNTAARRNSSNLNYNALLYIQPEIESTHEDYTTLRDNSNEYDSTIDSRNSPPKKIYPTEPILYYRLLKNPIGFSVPLEKIPNWNSYFNDQKDNIGSFSGEDVKMYYEPCADINRKVSVWFDDITMLKVDAIVNSTTRNFSGIGGVDRAIHRVAGEQLKQGCQVFDACKAGSSCLTGGYSLPSKCVIHTNAPYIEDLELLQSCYISPLNLLCTNKLRTIAFPCIGTGLKGYSHKKAAHIALKIVRMYLEFHGDKIDRVIFCLHNRTSIVIYRHLMQAYFPVE